MRSMPIELVRKVLTGVVMLILTRNPEPDVPDEVRNLHGQHEAGHDGVNAYE